MQLGYSRLVLKMRVIDHDLQGYFGDFDSEFLKNWLIHAIICNGFRLELLNLHLGTLSAGIENGAHTLFHEKKGSFCRHLLVYSACLNSYA